MYVTPDVIPITVTATKDFKVYTLVPLNTKIKSLTKSKSCFPLLSMVYKTSLITSHIKKIKNEDFQ